ncbi:MAG: aspartate aminotransferase family protein [Gammaproteobacteria bacterium]|nr:aspartate aminotransferase family protein [Gammaproteobacteria bacterium]
MLETDSALLPTYARLPVRFVRGQGCRLWDENGDEYLDAVAGIAVCALGHCHPDVTAVLREQAGILVHTSNLYRIEPQETLASRLTEASGMERAFFCNSGAEANECALKIARLHAARKNITSPEVLVVEGAFHGRTLMTLSASSGARVRDGFAPYAEGFVRVGFNDLPMMQAALAQHPNAVAVLIEPIQGEGGVRPVDDDYLVGLRKLCDAHDALLILDEVQTGMGRTGRLFAYQHAGILPDAVTLAKALGNGYPIGACLTRGTAATALTAGQHGTTFGGSHLACRVGLSVLDALDKEQLLERAEQLGNTLMERFHAALAGLPGIESIRGRGLMIGIELSEPVPDLVARALQARLLINVTQERVIRLLPPLVMSDEEADLLCERLIPLLTEVAGGTA